MRGEEFLTKLREEAAMLCPRGGSKDFHPKLNAWVDDASSVARVLRAMDEREQA